jgi:DNA-binding IclR family transcriptional regulator
VLLGADILYAVAQATEGVGPRLLATKVRAPLATVYRIAQALQTKGLIVQDEVTKAYRLGDGAAVLAAAFQRGEELIGASLPSMRRLRDLVGETVCLHVRVGEQRIPIAQVESTHEIRYVTEVGLPQPLHAGAASKLLMAYLPPAELKRLITRAGRKRFTRQTITERRRLAAELEEIRRAGFAISFGERVAGAVGVAAPIFRLDGSVRACLSIFGPDSRLDAKAIATHREAFLAATRRIGSRLAGRDGVDQIAGAVPEPVVAAAAVASSRARARR